MKMMEAIIDHIRRNSKNSLVISRSKSFGNKGYIETVVGGKFHKIKLSIDDSGGLCIDISGRKEYVDLYEPNDFDKILGSFDDMYQKILGELT